MLNEGLTAMAVGMGTVFSFLIILMFVVFALGKLVLLLNRLFPEEVQAVKAAVKKVCEESDIAVAIAVAKAKN